MAHVVVAHAFAGAQHAARLHADERVHRSSTMPDITLDGIDVT